MDSIKEIAITTCLVCKKQVATYHVYAGINLFLCPRCQTFFYSSGGKKVVLKKGERGK